MQKSVGNFHARERRLISDLMDFVMLKFSFEFHNFLWAFDKQKFSMLTLLDVRRSVRCLCFLLVRAVLKFKFSVRGAAC